MGRLTCLKPRLATVDTRRALPEAGPERAATGSAWRTIRRQAMTRDCGMCRKCFSEGLFVLASDVDHVVPVWEGGTDALTNLQSLCKPCHKAKTAVEAARRASTGAS